MSESRGDRKDSAGGTWGAERTKTLLKNVTIVLLTKYYSENYNENVDVIK